MLFANTTLSLRFSISPPGARLCNIRQQDRATTVRGKNGGFSDHLYTAHHQPPKLVSTQQLTLSDSDGRPSEIYLAVVSSQERLAQNDIFIYLAHHKDFFQLYFSHSDRCLLSSIKLRSRAISCVGL